MIKKDRLVALFDILGFGSRLKTDSLAQLRRQLREFVRAIRSAALTTTTTNLRPEDDDNLESARFVFDSVLLVSHETSDPENVRKFIFACVALLEFGFQFQFPFRGSITLTDVFNDEETGLVLGEQFPELRDAEKMQEWTGCFVHERAMPVVRGALMAEGDVEAMMAVPGAYHMIHWLEVPLKEAAKDFRPFKAWCLNWAQMLDQSTIEPGLEYLKKDSLKHANTKRYIDYIYSLPRRLAPLSGGNVPDGTMTKMIQCAGKFRVVTIDSEGNTLPISGKLQFLVMNDAKESVDIGTYQMPQH